MKFYFSYILVLLVFIPSITAFSQSVKELNDKNQSLSYNEVISFYTKLDDQFETAKLITEGMTDAGIPLHLFIISADKKFDPVDLSNRNKIVFLINNGIHPGEPDGIDASARFSEYILSNPQNLPENVIVCIIPVYNIDGSLNRGCCSRANQNGPELYGFRGNGQNLDLNRDFIKCDSDNAKSFTKIFREWNPDVFLDTHVSNGADYQYTMTLISTQHNKLGGPAGEYLKSKMIPSLFSGMKESGNEMSPYVNTARYDDNPENGIYGFMEIPRYASGYAALYSCLSFVSETHMLKPFASRVESNIALLNVLLNYIGLNAKEILDVRRRTVEINKSKKEFTLAWELDSTRSDKISFKGFEASQKISKVTGQSQIYYDRTKPFTREIKFYDHYKTALKVNRPEYYIIPQAWKQVIRRLERNKVEMKRFLKDTTLEVETYIINDFKTSKDPYEGHYLHSNLTVTTEVKKIQYRKGDYTIRMNQENNRLIVETLEPKAPDSWFAWGFFDAILQQKEWFSAYVFDETALKILEQNSKLKADFEKKKAEDPEFASSGFAQLYFIYRNSDWFEDYRRYPVTRFNGKL